MAEKKQFFREIQPGDVSIEGRQSNGITAKSDGSVILYSGVKDNELDNLQNYNGTVPIDGYYSNIIAVLKSDQKVAFPIGNNNEETYFESKVIDPNKIIITNQPTDFKSVTQVTNPPPGPTPTPTPIPIGPPLPTEEETPSIPALEYIGETDEFLFIQASSQIFEDDEVDYYRDVTSVDGLLWIATAGYSVNVNNFYNAERNGITSKNSRQILDAAKSMIDEAINKYPMIADKSKYPDAMNRLLAMCLVAYNECRFDPQPENPHYTFNNAKEANIWHKSLTDFYNKFGVKSGHESLKDSGNAQIANPEAIFNAVYASRMGNGDESSGDGYKYRGRGYYGITGKGSYEKVGKELYQDKNIFLNNPDLVNNEPYATEMFLTSMFEGGLCALGIGLLAYTTTPDTIVAGKNKYNVGSIVSVTLPRGNVKKIRGDMPDNYTKSKGANNLVNGNSASGYEKNFNNIYNSQELKNYINSKLK